MVFFPSLLSMNHNYGYIPFPTFFAGAFQEFMEQNKLKSVKKKKFNHSWWASNRNADKNPGPEEGSLVVTMERNVFKSETNKRDSALASPVNYREQRACFW